MFSIGGWLYQNKAPTRTLPDDVFTSAEAHVPKNEFAFKIIGNIEAFAVCGPAKFCCIAEVCWDHPLRLTSKRQNMDRSAPVCAYSDTSSVRRQMKRPKIIRIPSGKYRASSLQGVNCRENLLLAISLCQHAHV